MNLALTDDETAVLLRELDGLIDGDRYFLSPRIKRSGGPSFRPDLPSGRAPRAASVKDAADEAAPAEPVTGVSRVDLLRLTILKFLRAPH